MPEASTASAPELVAYTSFVHDLEQGRIESVEIFDHGNIDLTYHLSGGGYRGVNGPIGLDDEALLAHSLQEASVPFIIRDAKYDGPGSMTGGFGGMMHLTSAIMFLIPLMMMWVIARQSKTIQTLSTKQTQRSDFAEK